ncbi:hypothetical protein [uncultured Ruminococcus sp.]|uniref:hypothetical protein n=1 Tax=uncultured Ruminococcus sp. TaxID=165186 RepID=UPI00260EA225|nr:hypothetical protein [uncultured Ruminococcus sp.]
MSAKEKAMILLDRMTEEQLQGLLMMFQNLLDPPDFPEEEPDEVDRALIADSKVDNDESMSLDEFIKELGFVPDDLRA